MEWKSGATSEEIVAGGNGRGNGDNQLSNPTDVTVDKEKDSLIICDMGNKRVVRWPRRGGTNGETIISDIHCYGLTMDDLGFIYVADYNEDEVTRWQIGEKEGTPVAGGNCEGYGLHQLNNPTRVLVDRDYSVYVSDEWNNRVMKWMKGAKEGIIVAGGQGKGKNLTQLSYPQGLIVDQLGTIYVSDLLNHRIMRWSKEATEGTIIVGANGEGTQSNQLINPNDLSFDRHGNLIVVDKGNVRVQKFLLDRH
jgi:sugar lactone lactonase YvrE